MKKKSAADRLIAGARARKANPLTPDAKTEIRKIMAYNDKAPKRLRVKRAEVAAMLAVDHGIPVTPHTLDRWIHAEFGRGI
jgi:hypothetical protein